MFDPSKLNLDLNQEAESNPDTSTPEIGETTTPVSTNSTDEMPKVSVVAEPSVAQEEIILEPVEAPLTEIDPTPEEGIEQTEAIASAPSVLFDINITSLDDVVLQLQSNEYDFVLFEADSEKVKLSFRKDKIEQEVKYIKFPIYTNILIKAKTQTKLDVNTQNKEQEGKGEINIKNVNFNLVTKVVPHDAGEKLFLKAIKNEKKIVKKVEKKTSLSTLLGFLGTLIFIGLVLGGAFISFIAINAQTVEDVRFFTSIGINLNDINIFMGKVVSIIFSILVFIETVFLIIFLFKFSFTKKEFKQKKIKFGVLSALFLIITFSTASAWLFVDKKISSLPNFQDIANGNVQLFDNSKLLSSEFDKQGSLIGNTSNLIGPVEIKFDLSVFKRAKLKKNIKINKFIWKFGEGDTFETPNATLIREFSQKGNNEISLTVEEVGYDGEVNTVIVDDIPSINISYLVDVNETPLKTGGKLVEFDASSLSELGKIEWYTLENLDEPIGKGAVFSIGRAIVKETIIGMYIRRDDKTSEVLDKIFVISGEEETGLDGTVEYTQSIDNDLEYEFKVANAKNDFGNGYIESFAWKIGDQEYTTEGNIEDPESASKVKHTFTSYGDQDISVTLTDSLGETKTLKSSVKISQKVKLKIPVSIKNNGTKIDTLEYKENTNEYFLGNIGAPTTLDLSARFVRPEDNLYGLSKVEWDFNSDGDIDSTEKVVKYDINTPENHTITVTYSFKHRKKDEVLTLTERIYVDAIHKDAIVDLKILKENNYAPITVGFDASKSRITDGNITKFIWDFGDGNIEERGSIVSGHKYLKKGEYTIKLTIVGEDGKRFDTSKQLILVEPDPIAQISTSLKQTVPFQNINFSSKKSEGQIQSYFWDFGDGEVSFEANPTHFYSKPGEYTVKLKLDFSNQGVETDEIKITIIKE